MKKTFVQFRANGPKVVIGHAPDKEYGDYLEITQDQNDAIAQMHSSLWAAYLLPAQEKDLASLILYGVAFFVAASLLATAIVLLK